MKNRSIRTAGIAPLIARTLRHPSLLRDFTGFLRWVIGGFFLNQHFCRRVPVALVSHPLDREIPYDTGVSGLYLDFVQSWMRMLSWLFRQKGRKALPPVRRFIREMTRFYREAAWIYNRHKSTTPRPPAGRNPLTRIIHRADPHLHCIPSLHVIIVCTTWLRFDPMARELNIPPEVRIPQEAYLRRHALDITDAILLMKQHSLNCIASSLFFLHHFLPQFTDKTAEAITEDLFRLMGTRTVLPPAFGSTARKAIRSRYRHLRSREESFPAGDYKAVILESLKKYPPPGSFASHGIPSPQETTGKLKGETQP